MAAREMIEGTGVCLCNYLNSASVLTLSSHHPLCVPLGQHPHVTIETRLLHWGGMMKWMNRCKQSTLNQHNPLTGATSWTLTHHSGAATLTSALRIIKVFLLGAEKLFDHTHSS